MMGYVEMMLLDISEVEFVENLLEFGKYLQKEGEFRES